MAEGVERSSSNRRSTVQSQSSSSACLSVLGQDTEPRIASHRKTDARYECVCERVNGNKPNKRFEWSLRPEKRYIYTQTILFIHVHLSTFVYMCTCLPAS